MRAAVTHVDCIIFYSTFTVMEIQNSNTNAVLYPPTLGSWAGDMCIFNIHMCIFNMHSFAA